MRLTLLAAMIVLVSGCGRERRASAESGDMARAGELFASVCARCHGAEGKGGVGHPPPRNFCDPAFQASRSDEELMKTIRNGRGGAMPPFGAVFSDAEIRALVGKVRSFDPSRGAR